MLHWSQLHIYTYICYDLLYQLCAHDVGTLTSATSEKSPMVNLHWFRGSPTKFSIYRKIILVMLTCILRRNQRRPEERSAALLSCNNYNWIVFMYVCLCVCACVCVRARAPADFMRTCMDASMGVCWCVCVCACVRAQLKTLYPIANVLKMFEFSVHHCSFFFWSKMRGGKYLEILVQTMWSLKIVY